MISALPLELISAMMNSIEIAVAPRNGEEESECATNAGRVRWDGRNGREREAMIHLVEEKREVVLLGEARALGGKSAGWFVSEPTRNTSAPLVPEITSQGWYLWRTKP